METDPRAGAEEVARARALVAGAERVLALTGAGISTDSGIPDFRGPRGLWTKDPGAERRATIDVYLSEPDVRRQAWARRLGERTRPVPNAGHRALLELERRGVLDTLVTQNVDGLHLEAGHDPGRVVEIHGTTREVQCMSCGARRPMEEVLARVRAGEDDPACLERAAGGECGGILKSATVSFGQSLVPHDLARAEEAALRCDLVLAVGTTLGVYPAAGLVPLARRAGAAVVIVNGEPTELDFMADVVVRGQIGEVLPRIVAGGGEA
ncbi:MAG: Sir2 family NAD-dependent protein deacetylase [Acidobacteriota bacterium]|nr:Sir2 family NAD-dependent protein deacetylase [Acidobacteriota bacterium]